MQRCRISLVRPRARGGGFFEKLHYLGRFWKTVKLEKFWKIIADNYPKLP